jgi:hypothetical protein
MVRYISDGLARLIIALTAAPFIEESGKVLLGRFQKIATSIIGIIIPPTTALQIWNACPDLNIHASPFIGEPPSRKPPERLQQSGIALKRADCGIDSNPKNASPGGSASVSRAIASIAALNLWPSFATSIRSGFARPNADRLGVMDTASQPDAIRISNRKTGNGTQNIANSAAMSLWQLSVHETHKNSAQSLVEPPSITTGRPPVAPSIVGNGNPRSATSAVSNLWHWFARRTSTGSVQISAESLVIASVKHLVEREDTCCIEVPDIHCFALANGAVVHNSHCADAFRTLAVSIRAPQKEREKVEQRQKAYASPWS